MIQPDQDVEHLRLLSVFHYVLAGLMALCACIPVIHVIMGVAMIARARQAGGEGGGPPVFVGWILLGVGVTLIVVGWALAICVFLSARFIAQRKCHMFCLVVAGFSCLFFPLGTALGVFTFVVLLRPSVKRMFGSGAAPPVLLRQS